MIKKKKYHNTYFDPVTIKKGFDKLYEYFLNNKLIPEINSKYYIETRTLTIEKNYVTYNFDSEDEFLNEYRNDPDEATFSKIIQQTIYTVHFHNSNTDVTVDGTNRSTIESVFSIFEDDLGIATKIENTRSVDSQRIFIGHGRSPQWRELKDHLTDKHGYKIVAYEVGARAGHTIRDILDEMLHESSLAFLVLTGEDSDENGNLHARENVIHETGLFQGRLGFSKAIVLLEENTNQFTNISGIDQIRFKKGNIRETFGDVLSVIKREFDK